MSSNTVRARHRADTKINSNRSRSGQALIPQAGPKVAALLITSGMLVAGVSPVHASATSPSSQAVKASATAPSTDVPVTDGGSATSGIVYTVQAGDTLGLVSIQTGVALQELLTLNQLTVTSIIYPGNTIVLSGKSGSAENTNPMIASSGGSEFSLSVQSESINPLSKRVSNESGNMWDSASASQTGTANSRILAFARSQVGAIQDCTVLGEGALRAAGVMGVGDESPESLMDFATPVSDPQPGDFVYYADGGMGFSHNAIYLGDGRAMHSGWNGNQTVEQSVNVGSGPVYYRVIG